MKVRIDEIYGTFHHPGFNKFEVIARCYVNGKMQYKRLFFESRQEAEGLGEGTWIDY